MSNAEFVRGLKPLPFETTTFEQAISLKPGDAGNSFEAFLPKDWLTTNYTYAHGGFLTTLIQATTREYFRLRYPTLKQPDAIHLQTQFLYPVPGGALTVVVKDLKIGNKVSMVQVDLQTKGDDDALVTRVTSLVTQGNLVTEKGVTGKKLSNYKDSLPRKEYFERWADAWWMNIIPINRKLRQYTPVGGPNLRWNDRLGPGYREEWIKMDDESGFDVRILGKLCDPFLSMPTTYPPDPNEALKDLMAFVYPTISMTTEIRRDPKGAEWLFVKIRSQKVENGRYSVDITILDEEGDLVALSRNMGLMIAVPGGLKVVGSAEKL